MKEKYVSFGNVEGTKGTVVEIGYVLKTAFNHETGEGQIYVQDIEDESRIHKYIVDSMLAQSIGKLKVSYSIHGK